MATGKQSLSRRKFLAGSLVSAGAAGAARGGQGNGDADSRQATGVKVGEVSDTGVIVWMRLTAEARPVRGGRDAPRGDAVPPEQIARLPGACPGAAGRVRLRYGTDADLAGAKATPWAEVNAASDFTRQVRLTDLQPATVYHYAAETTGPGGKPVHAPLRGRFETAPPQGRYADITFTVLSCSAFRDLDHDDGFHIFPAMAALRPKFYVHTGDNVYYDSDTVTARGIDLARHHWHRMHSLPRHVAFHAQVPGYWEKDDHDTLQNDCWPGGSNAVVAPLTFAQGLAIFREQVPMGERTYRTFRWGKGLQIWLVEGRDFRSPNSLRDGPDKTIWGKQQKQWLFETLQASDADFKVLISPTPIVGPDRPGKRDNHANAAFRNEGDELRRWFQKNLAGGGRQPPDDMRTKQSRERFFWINGDRHWQYHSVHPETGLHEFCPGAASDPHAGGSPGLDRKVHRFHRVRGGFLSVTFRRNGQRGAVMVRHHDVMGKVMHEHEFGGG
jgi:alkaline phosphatase D